MTKKNCAIFGCSEKPVLFIEKTVGWVPVCIEHGVKPRSRKKTTPPQKEDKGTLFKKRADSEE